MQARSAMIPKTVHFRCSSPVYYGHGSDLRFFPINSLPKNMIQSVRLVSNVFKCTPLYLDALNQISRTRAHTNTLATHAHGGTSSALGRGSTTLWRESATPLWPGRRCAQSCECGTGSRPIRPLPAVVHNQPWVYTPRRTIAALIAFRTCVPPSWLLTIPRRPRLERPRRRGSGVTVGSPASCSAVGGVMVETPGRGNRPADCNLRNVVSES